MLSQTRFMHFVAAEKLPAKIRGSVRAHVEIFDELLGKRHNHVGIEVANSGHAYCVDGCRWYFEKGPFEWSKRAYSDAWWAEMNGTEWDWVRMRTYIEDVVRDGERGDGGVEMFETHLRRFVPRWFWESEEWEMCPKIRIVKGEDGRKRTRLACWIRYRKSEGEVIEERDKLMKAMGREGGDEDVKIEPFGTYVMLVNDVFDAEAYVHDWEEAELKSIGKWLSYWGFEAYKAGEAQSGLHR